MFHPCIWMESIWRILNEHVGKRSMLGCSLWRQLSSDDSFPISTLIKIQGETCLGSEQALGRYIVYTSDALRCAAWNEPYELL